MGLIQAAEIRHKQERIRVAEMVKFCEGYLPDCDTKKAVLDAVMKQMPVKVEDIRETPEEIGKIGYDKCPFCGIIVGNNYCRSCGRKLEYRINPETESFRSEP